jgi:hypothetical protein
MDNRPKEYEEANDQTTAMNSMSECLSFLNGKGFTEQFKVVGNKLISLSNEEAYAVNDVTAINFYRFEGSSDPDDTAILYAIETKDGKKGTLVNAYGAYADDEVDEFVKEMEIHKKPVNKQA